MKFLSKINNKFNEWSWKVSACCALVWIALAADWAAEGYWIMSGLSAFVAAMSGFSAGVKVSEEAVVELHESGEWTTR